MKGLWAAVLYIPAFWYFNQWFAWRGGCGYGQACRDIESTWFIAIVGMLSLALFAMRKPEAASRAAMAAAIAAFAWITRRFLIPLLTSIV